MITGTIVTIVEGHGEYDAVPALIRRVMDRECAAARPTLRRPIRESRTRLVKTGELERAVELASRSARPGGALLILLDSDGECPATLGPSLLTRATTAVGDIPIAVVIAHQEFEAWFVAAAASLRGQRGFPEDLEEHPDPESLPSPKGWLGSRRPGRPYSETLDQPALTAVMDIDSARRAPSFDKLMRVLETWLR